MAAFWIGTSSSSRSVGQHEAADMLREMAREAAQRGRQFERQHQAGIGGIEAGLAHMAFIDAARPMPHTVSAMAPTVSGDRPSALPTSRMALRLL